MVSKVPKNEFNMDTKNYAALWFSISEPKRQVDNHFCVNKVDLSMKALFLAALNNITISGLVRTATIDMMSLSDGAPFITNGEEQS